MAMSPVTVADGDSTGNVEGGEQGCDAVPFVIVRLPSRHAGSQRENRLGAVQRLYLALLIHTQHHRPIWRIHIQSHDVSNLFDEQRIFGELEVLHPMRL